MDTGIVLLHGFKHEEVMAIMKAVKSVIGDPARVAFATTTPTNVDWKVSDLIEHVTEEHAAFVGRHMP